MGSWGVKSLESDEGLDFIDFLQDFPERFNIKLFELITAMKQDGFFGESFKDIDFYYDNSAMAVTELYLEYLDTKTLHYDHEESEKDLSRIQSFSADKRSLEFLNRYLIDIRNEVPDKDEMREIVELWSDHLDNLIKRISREISNFTE